MMDRGRKDTLKHRNLDELARLGGVNIVVLPQEYAAAVLTLPICFAATATYLSQHGYMTPGIFRVPGQLSTVNALYDHYAQQFEQAQKTQDEVQQTVSSGLLPTHIPYNVHDVASVFKKFLAGVPGGLLGSLALFQALKDIHTFLRPGVDLMTAKPTKVKARLIALAIASVVPEYRLALISAALGLAAQVTRAAVKVKDGSNEDYITPNSDRMGPKALGVVLGPLLLGDLTEEIRLDSWSQQDALLVQPQRPEKRRKAKRHIFRFSKAPTDDTVLILHVERANMTAAVMEMLISNWEEVVRHFRGFGNSQDVSLLHPQPRTQPRRSERKTFAIELTVNGPSNPDLEGPLRPLDEHVSSRVSLPIRVDSNIPQDTCVRASSPCEAEILGEAEDYLRSSSPHHSDRVINDDSSAIYGNDVPATREKLAISNIRFKNEESLDASDGSFERTATDDVTAGNGGSLTAKENMNHLASNVETHEALENLPGMEAQIETTAFTALKPSVAGYHMVEEIVEDSSVCPHDIDQTSWKCWKEKSSYAASRLRQTAYSESPNEGPSSLQPNVWELPKYIPRPGTPPSQLSVYKPTAADQAAIDPPKLGSTVVLGLDHREDELRTSIGSWWHEPDSQSDTSILSDRIDSSNEVVKSSSMFSLNPSPVAASGQRRKEPKKSPIFRKYRNTVSSDVPLPQVCEARDSICVSPVERLSRVGSNELGQGRYSPFSFIEDSPANRALTPQGLAEVTNRLHVLVSKATDVAVMAEKQSPELAGYACVQNGISTQQDSGIRKSLNGNATLYAEIRRLQRQLELRTEEALQARRQLEAMRDYRESATLSDKLREAQKELKAWQDRAQWAEKKLLMQDERRPQETSVMKGKHSPGVRKAGIGLTKATMASVHHFRG
ncbi:MAG: hypothetical protein M1827_001424 [Pycnora praestabilis]|nr:MAG: hypothetical protein M1827_001424 [Pycnora praestabilis]